MKDLVGGEVAAAGALVGKVGEDAAASFRGLLRGSCKRDSERTTRRNYVEEPELEGRVLVTSDLEGYTADNAKDCNYFDSFLLLL